MIQQAAMDQMLAAPPGGGADPMADPFAMGAPAGYTPVMVPDAVLPAVMELVNQAEQSGGGLSASSMSPADATMGGMPLL